MKFHEGDYVTRKSYNSDIIFKIENIKESIAILRSYRLRLMADAPLDDLVKYEKGPKDKLKKKLLVESYECLKRKQRNIVLNENNLSRNSTENSYREIPGNVLHIDGDKDYLDMSLQNYKMLQIQADGFFIPEKGQPSLISKHLKEYKPDILVITGHDGIMNDSEYKASKYFVESVKVARNYENDLDKLIIFAGACQSSYKKLINNGANFASSPTGNLIHFLDPILVVEKIAYTSIKEVISIKDIINCTLTKNTVGGVETRGKMRLGYP